MLKALLRKQFLELNQFYFRDRKSGKLRSRGGVIGYVALFVVIFAALGAFFGMMEATLLDGLAPAGYTWLYFAVSALIAIALGTFGSVFNTYEGLYHARDNELLLAMPVPPAKLLLVRMTGVYAMGLLYEAIVFIPAMIVYWARGGVTAWQVAAPVLLLFIIGVLVLVLTCALGWVVALVSAKLKNRSFLTVLLSLAFIVIYYIVYFRLNQYIQSIVTNAEQVGRSFRTALWPLYQIGLACTGGAAAFAVTTALAAALLALLVWVMGRSFTRIVTASSGGKKSVYRRRAMKNSGRKAALLRKELRRFTASPGYMLNCGLGIVLMPVLAAAALIKMGWVRETLGSLLEQIPALEAMVPVLAAGALCLLCATNVVSAPSVALEGRSLWLLQSLPVPAGEALAAKEKLHILLNGVPALLLGVVLAVVLRLEAVTAVFMLTAALAFTAFTGALGLVLGLRRPNLEWTNETVPIKQSMSVTITLFGGWLLALAVGLLYYPLLDVLAPAVYLLGVTAVFALAAWLLNRWLARRGAAIFASL